MNVVVSITHQWNWGCGSWWEGRGSPPHLAPHEETKIAARRCWSCRGQQPAPVRHPLSPSRSHQAALVTRVAQPSLAAKGDAEVR